MIWSYETSRKITSRQRDTLLAYLDHLLESNISKTFQGDRPPLSTEEFCDYSDHYTLKIIKLLLHRTQTEILFKLCEYVVMGRTVVDWAQPNKLITLNGWNNWRKHMCVRVILLATLLTAVASYMVFIRSQRNHTAITCGICSVGIFPVVLVTGFISIATLSHNNKLCIASCSLRQL